MTTKVRMFKNLKDDEIVKTLSKYYNDKKINIIDYKIITSCTLNKLIIIYDKKGGEE